MLGYWFSRSNNCTHLISFFVKTQAVRGEEEDICHDYRTGKTVTVLHKPSDPLAAPLIKCNGVFFTVVWKQSSWRSTTDFDDAYFSCRHVGSSKVFIEYIHFETLQWMHKLCPNSGMTERACQWCNCVLSRRPRHIGLLCSMKHS